MQIFGAHCGLLLVLFSVFVAINGEHTYISERIRYGVSELLGNDRKTLQLANDIEELQAMINVTQRNEEMCKVCKHTTDEIIKMRRHGMNKETFQKQINNLCKLFTDWDLSTCSGYINIETDAVLYMIDNGKDLTGERACSIYLQQHGCVDSNRKDWDVVIPTATESTNDQVLTHDGADVKKILHLTDFHYDPLYEPGSNARCQYQLCCQKNSGRPNKTEDAAGFWGDYNVCDIPWHTVMDVLSHIKKQHPQMDYVYYTGDIISHRSWDTSVVSNTDAIKKIYSQFYESFGKIPVYPVLGNHEPHPTDFWSNENSTNSKLSTQWLFNLVSQEWSRWLPTDALKTVKLGGYYTVLVKPGHRIIALNSNVCYVSNLWLIFTDNDPFGQLQWLADTLERAEAAGEMVHVLSHVPPGNILCLSNWNEVFVKIVNRFSHVIKGQFNGHTHYDEFRVFYDQTKRKVTNVAYNGGSFTTFVGLNPNYRVYDVDFKNYEVADYEQWTYNMTEANLTPNKSPNWFKLYSFKEAYGIPSMSLDNLGLLVERMSKDKTLMEMYYRFEVRESGPYMKAGCNDACVAAKLCAIKGIHFADSILCNDI